MAVQSMAERSGGTGRRRGWVEQNGLISNLVQKWHTVALTTFLVTK